MSEAIRPSTSSSCRRPVGAIAVDRGLISPVQLREALSNQIELKKMGLPELLGGILLKKKLITKDDLDGILKEQCASETGQKVRRLGNFEIHEKVGQGAMGVVFKARQITMDRTVAVKILAPKYANDPVFIERFVKEARAAGQFSHENIVSALDVGYLEPYHYFAMEYVEGRTLRKLIEEQQFLPEKEALNYTLQIARGLEHALLKNILHRDVKPENIIVTPQGVAKLLDMGLACAVGASAEDEAPHSNKDDKKSRQAAGTPHYISPEAAKGEDLDTRADIYSLGCTLYQMLTGETPYKGSNSRAVMAQHVTGEFPDAKQKRADLSAPVAHVLLLMTSKDRAERYADPTALIEDLDLLLAGRTPKHAAPLRNSGPRSTASGPRKTVPGERTGSQTPTPLQAGNRPGLRSASNTSLKIGVAVAALVVLGFVVVLLLSGKGGDQRSAQPLRGPEEDPKHRAGAPEQKVVVRSKPSTGPTRTDLAREALVAAQKLLQERPDDHAALLAAFERAKDLAANTEVAPAAAEAWHAANTRHAKALDGALIAIGATVAKALSKGDYAVAAEACREEALAATLRAGAWQAPLWARRKTVSDAAEAKAAELLRAAREKARSLSTENFAAAVALAKKAEAIPAALAPSAKVAAEERARWEQALTSMRKALERAKLERMGKSKELSAAVRKELAPLLQQNRFTQAKELLNTRLREATYADAQAELELERSDLEALLTLRKDAIERLNMRDGEEVSLRKSSSTMKGKIKKDSAPGVTLVMEKGMELMLSAEQLEADDVDLYVPRSHNAEDLRRRGLLFLAAGQNAKAKDFFTQAQAAGLGDLAKPYLERIAVFELGEHEAWAQKAWKTAEELFNAKQWKAAQEAYVLFDKRATGSREHDARKAELLARMDATSVVLNPYQPGLVASIYNGDQFKEGDLLAKRIDAKVDFYWGREPIGENLPNVNFCVRWNGFIKIEKAGIYTFATETDDGQRLWVKGQQLVDDWTVHTMKIQTGSSLELQPGFYEIRMEMNQGGGEAGAKLWWALKDGFEAQIVPPTALYHNPRTAPQPKP